MTAPAAGCNLLRRAAAMTAPVVGYNPLRRTAAMTAPAMGYNPLRRTAVGYNPLWRAHSGLQSASAGPRWATILFGGLRPLPPQRWATIRFGGLLWATICFGRPSGCGHDRPRGGLQSASAGYNPLRSLRRAAARAASAVLHSAEAMASRTRVRALLRRCAGDKVLRYWAKKQSISRGRLAI